MKAFYALVAMMILTSPAFATDATDTELHEETIQPIDAVSAAPSDISDNSATVARNSKTKFPSGLQIGVGLSATSGLNGFVGYANKNFDSFWLKRLGVRLDFSTTAPVKSLIDSGINSIIGDGGAELGDGMVIEDAYVKGHHAAVLVDFYPFGDTWFLGGIRVSGGYYFGELSLGADLGGAIGDLPDDEMAFELNGVNYRYTGNQIHGGAQIDWNYRGPYLGAGFDLGLFAGFKIYFDAGVVFTSHTPQVDLNLPIDNLQVYDGVWKPVADDPILSDAFNQAKSVALSDARDALSDLNFYPMIKIGFMYRF